MSESVMRKSNHIPGNCVQCNKPATEKNPLVETDISSLVTWHNFEAPILYHESCMKTFRRADIELYFEIDEKLKALGLDRMRYVPGGTLYINGKGPFRASIQDVVSAVLEATHNYGDRTWQPQKQMNESKHIPAHPNGLEEYLGGVTSAEVLHILEMTANTTTERARAFHRDLANVNQLRVVAGKYSSWCVSAEYGGGDTEFVGFMLVPIRPNE